MTQLTASQLLGKIKTALGITGDYQDEIISGYIDEAQSFMRRAGVPAAIATSEEAAGTVARIVSDLWSYGPGGVKLSPYAIQRVIQLAYSGEEGGSSDA